MAEKSILLLVLTYPLFVILFFSILLQLSLLFRVSAVPTNFSDIRYFFEPIVLPTLSQDNFQ